MDSDLQGNTGLYSRISDWFFQTILAKQMEHIEQQDEKYASHSKKQSVLIQLPTKRRDNMNTGGY